VSEPTAREVFLTVDVEPDCPPYLGGWRGIEEGLPKLLDVLAAERVAATLFVTGEVAKRFPDAVRGAVAQGHELGCHGDTHERFSRMTRSAARDEIARASDALRRFAPTTAFRAPNLDFPDAYLPLLVEAGYRVDSSEGAHRVAHRVRAARRTGAPPPAGLVRAPASTTSSALRLPAPMRDPWLARLRRPAVLFVHPWEFVDLRGAPVPWDCRAGTGARALESVREVIRLFRGRGARFGTMRDLARDAAQEHAA
jgi:peptidoglycan/xylan/chitin deacetylase (PgdA/CDA1 family)